MINLNRGMGVLAWSLAFGTGSLGAAFASAAGSEISVEGTLEVHVIDDFQVNRHETEFFLEKSGGQGRLKLRFKDSAPAGLMSGRKVKAKGKISGSVLELSAASLSPAETEDLTVSYSLVSGVQKTLAVLVDFSDKSLSCSASTMDQLLFSGTTSINAFYQESSFQNVSFAGDIVGPVTINYTATGCDYPSWESAANQQLASMGVSLSNYRRIVYLFPSAGCGSTAGRGMLGGTTTKSWIYGYCSNKMVIGHELGHNLGVHHASTPGSEYGDGSDTMGNKGFFHFNAPHKIAMGWIPGARAQTISRSGIHTVTQLESSSAAIQALEIKKSTGGAYYLSFRQPSGFDASLSTLFQNRVSVHSWSGSVGLQTMQLATLGDGETYTDSTLGMSFTVLSHDGASATVQIQLPDAPCVRAAPSVAISPASQAGTPGQQLAYSVSVTNRDSGSCGSSTFSLSGTVPAGFSQSLSVPSLTLPAGASGSAGLLVSSASTSSGGSYSLSARATDMADATRTGSAGATYLVNAPDTVAPSAPGNLVATAGKRKATLSWSASMDDSGTVIYRIYRDGAMIAQTSARSYTDSGLSGGAAYTYQVDAVDPSGNASAKSGAVSVTVLNGGRR